MLIFSYLLSITPCLCAGMSCTSLAPFHSQLYAIVGKLVLAFKLRPNGCKHKLGEAHFLGVYMPLENICHLLNTCGFAYGADYTDYNLQAAQCKYLLRIAHS